jgi:trimethylamine---corrinoid protein Co-methyltransferase
MSKIWSAQVATEEEISFFMDRVEALLENKGFKVDHPEFCEKLIKAGAKLGADGYVKFPRELQRESLALAPRSFLLAGIEPEYDVPIPHPKGSFYARGPIGQTDYLDPITGDLRKNTMADQLDYVMVQQELEHISMWGNFSVVSDDFPEVAADVHTAALCMQHCKKPAYWMPYSAKSVPYVTEMAMAIAGGSEALKKRPFLSLMSCSIQPLGIKHMDVEQILWAAKLGLPLHCTALPVAGANAPVTPQGIALLSTAEVIGQAIMAQIAGPGTPVMLSAFTYACDMRTMQTLIAPIEMAKARLLAAAVINRGYQLPCHAFCGGTDSHLLDHQAVAEEAYMTHLMALSDAVMIGDLGALETCMIASPLQMIIANDLVAMAKKVKEGLEITDDTLGFQDLMEAKADGTFLATEHTFKNFKNTCIPKTFTRAPRERWKKEGAKDLVEKARDEYRVLKERHQPVNHPEDVLKEIKSIADRASKEMIA